MKKLTGKQLRLVITLIIVVIFALSYEYIYMHFVDMAGDYQEKTELINAQISQRKNELDKEDQILTDTLELNSQIEEILAAFPVTLTKEENLLFIETMEKDLRMEISPITISDPSVFYTTKLPIRDESGNEILVTEGTTDTNLNASTTAEGAAVINDATALDEVAVTNEVATKEAVTNETVTNETITNEAASNNDTTIDEGTGQQYMTVLQSSINITFQTTYPKFKRVLKYIKEYPEKISVSNATLSYDSSTGDLLAAMTITRYALTGTGKKYEEPYIGDISIGTDNIFGDPLED